VFFIADRANYEPTRFPANVRRYPVYNHEFCPFFPENYSVLRNLTIDPLIFDHYEGK